MQTYLYMIKYTDDRNVSLFFKFLETEKIVHKIVANAGKNVSLICSGIDEKTKIETLTWKTTQTIIKYVNGKPLDQNQRVSCKAFFTIIFILF